MIVSVWAMEVSKRSESSRLLEWFPPVRRQSSFCEAPRRWYSLRCPPRHFNFFGFLTYLRRGNFPNRTRAPLLPLWQRCILWGKRNVTSRAIAVWVALVLMRFQLPAAACVRSAAVVVVEEEAAEA